MLYLVLLVGLYFTIRLAFPQVLRVGDMVRQLVRGGDSAHGVSSFESFAMALGGRVGVGNIAGVATAIHFGGPGAVFWMWITGILGAAIAVVESSLAQTYKEEVDGEYRGGPAFYIEKGLNARWFGMLYAIAAIFAFTVTGPSIQAFNIASTARVAFSFDPRITGVVVAILFCAVVLGGMKRIGRVCGLVVPFMAVTYILVALVIVGLHADQVPAMFGLIFRSAFGGEALYGGMLGAVIMWGVKRAVYSSEAGTGTGAQASAAAEVSHPVKQGLAQGFSIYVDTLFVCTMTALMILASNTYNVVGPDETLLVENLPGVKPGPAYTQAAFDSVMTGFGPAFIAVAMFFFAFTSLLSFGFYADTNLSYLLRGHRHQHKVIVGFQLLLAASIILGSYRSSKFAWALADIGVGIYTWINLIALVFLAKKAYAIYNDYEVQRKAGNDPVFDPRAIGIENAPVWEAINARRRTAERDVITDETPTAPTVR